MEGTDVSHLSLEEIKRLTVGPVGSDCRCQIVRGSEFKDLLLGRCLRDALNDVTVR